MSRQEAEGNALRARASAAGGELMRAMQHRKMRAAHASGVFPKYSRRDALQLLRQQPLANANANSQGNYAARDSQMRAPAVGASPTPDQEQVRSGVDRNWGARIRASIARLMEIDGLCLNPESYTKAAEKRKAREEEEAFHARVDELKEATDTAHKEYWNRLRDVYSASTAKKMRLTSKESPSPNVAASASSQRGNEHEALDALAVAAATEQFTPSELVPPAAKKPKPSSRRLNMMPSGAGTQNPVQVHDPALAKAVDKLAGKLSELLGQLQATSDAAAAEPILAAAATIALEATEMRRSEQVALTRMVEIEEHRQQIMQGLLEYAKRKEQRGVDGDGNKEGAGSATDSRDSLPPRRDA